MTPSIRATLRLAPHIDIGVHVDAIQVTTVHLDQSLAVERVTDAWAHLAKEFSTSIGLVFDRAEQASLASSKRGRGLLVAKHAAWKEESKAGKPWRVSGTTARGMGGRKLFRAHSG